jgi:hypothetical protein
MHKVETRRFVVGALVGGLLCAATPSIASSWTIHIHPAACLVKDVGASSFYDCGFSWTSDHQQVHTTAVHVDLDTSDASASAQLCARSNDGSFSACSAQKFAANGNGGHASIGFSSSSDLSTWTGNSNRYTYVRVNLPPGNDLFNGVAITTNP